MQAKWGSGYINAFVAVCICLPKKIKILSFLNVCGMLIGMTNECGWILSSLVAPSSLFSFSKPGTIYLLRPSRRLGVGTGIISDQMATYAKQRKKHTPGKRYLFNSE